MSTPVHPVTAALEAVIEVLGQQLDRGDHGDRADLRGRHLVQADDDDEADVEA